VTLAVTTGACLNCPEAAAQEQSFQDDGGEGQRDGNDTDSKQGIRVVVNEVASRRRCPSYTLTRRDGLLDWK
jgi:hypothetical protein